MSNDRMLDIEVKGELQKIGMCIQVLRGVNVSGLLREFGLNDSIGVLVDPTGWMAIHENAMKNERVVRALGVFLKEINAAWPEPAEAS